MFTRVYRDNYLLGRLIDLSCSPVAPLTETVIVPELNVDITHHDHNVPGEEEPSDPHDVFALMVGAVVDRVEVCVLFQRGKNGCREENEDGHYPIARIHSHILDHFGDIDKGLDVPVNIVRVVKEEPGNEDDEPHDLVENSHDEICHDQEGSTSLVDRVLNVGHLESESGKDIEPGSDKKPISGCPSTLTVHFTRRRRRFRMTTSCSVMPSIDDGICWHVFWPGVNAIMTILFERRSFERGSRLRCLP